MTAMYIEGVSYMEWAWLDPMVMTQCVVGWCCGGGMEVVNAVGGGGCSVGEGVVGRGGCSVGEGVVGG